MRNRGTAPIRQSGPTKTASIDWTVYEELHDEMEAMKEYDEYGD